MGFSDVLKEDEMEFDYEEDGEYLKAVKEAKSNPDKLMEYTRDNIINYFHSGQIIDWIKEFNLENNRDALDCVMEADDLNAIINWHMEFNTFTDVLVENIISTRNCALALDWVSAFYENVEELRNLILSVRDIYMICRWILYIGDDVEIRKYIIRNNRVHEYVDIIGNETGAPDNEILKQLYYGMPDEYKLGVII